MQLNKLFLCSLAGLGFLINTVSVAEAAKKASWTILVYIAADNSLAGFASYNINDMSAGLVSTDGVNVLVQWDKPEDNYTWRYKITPGGKVDAGTLNSEMGFNPEAELVNSMQWCIQDYPADNYALILWDHGSGVRDFEPGIAKSTDNTIPWLYLVPFGYYRGILYDDTQKTCLTNTGLLKALTHIDGMLGKKLDLIAMDACLMSMVEIFYQMKDLVTISVCSQQTIPGNGYPYSKFLKPLSLNPAITSPLELATNMVTSYKSFYTTQQPTPDFTLAAIDVTSIELLKDDIDQFIAAVAQCSQIDAKQTKKIIMAARKASIAFEMPEYIDLYSFYANVLQQIKKTSPKSSLILSHLPGAAKPITSTEYKKALTALASIIESCLPKISQVVLKKVAGPVYTGAKGISIYYPANGAIDPSYKATLFAQDTAWMQFIQQYS